jgi:acetyl-CoA carboxylase carboxyl transferase subunit beta
MPLFRKRKYSILEPKSLRSKQRKALWLKCEGCGGLIYRREWEENLKVCPSCNFHYRLSAKERIEITLDDGKITEIEQEITPIDFLGFKDKKTYSERLRETEEKVGLKDAAVVGIGKISGWELVFCVLDFGFMGGSMGSVVGEKITRAAELAKEKGLPFITCSSSGGARMQEGMASLMQMAKTSAAISKLNKEGNLYISILTNPTTGGVLASFASLGDIIIAEEKALIGFAGPRVIEQTIQQKLPSGFQSAEFLLKHGMIDIVVHRRRLKATISQLLNTLL